jgi:hypothetical protein
MRRQRPLNPAASTSVQQMALFPESSPMLDELAKLDVNSMSPLEAINKLYEWKRRSAAVSSAKNRPCTLVRR